MKNCSRCGAENPEEATFCSSCGGAFSKEEAPQAAPSPPPPPAAAGLQPGAVPPPQVYGQPPAGYPPPPPGTPYGAPYGPGQYPVMAQTSNGKATASLVLGIAGLFVCPFVLSVLAIIFGTTAKNEIAASGGWQTGESNAKAGIILGWIGLAITIIVIIVWTIVAVVASTNATMLPVSALWASL